MLVNLTPDEIEIERRMVIAAENKINFFIKQADDRLNTEVGIYQCNIPFNFSKEEFIEKFSYEQEYSYFAPEYEKAQYGVADSIEQIKEYYKKEISDKNNKFCISVTPVWQEPECKGEGGGWRWHKWGEYIGKLNPQCEYLDDEDFGDEFEYVLCFNLLHIID